MPVRLLRAYPRELPRLEAGETLRLVSAQQLGGGLLKQHEANSRLRDLKRQARGEREQTFTSSLDTLAAMRVANARAREAGMLWEQRLARGEVSA